MDDAGPADLGRDSPARWRSGRRRARGGPARRRRRACAGIGLGNWPALSPPGSPDDRSDGRHDEGDGVAAPAPTGGSRRPAARPRRGSPAGRHSRGRGWPAGAWPRWSRRGGGARGRRAGRPPAWPPRRGRPGRPRGGAGPAGSAQPATTTRAKPAGNRMSPVAIAPSRSQQGRGTPGRDDALEVPVGQERDEPEAAQPGAAGAADAPARAGRPGRAGGSRPGRPSVRASMTAQHQQRDQVGDRQRRQRGGEEHDPAPAAVAGGADGGAEGQAEEHRPDLVRHQPGLEQAPEPDPERGRDEHRQHGGQAGRPPPQPERPGQEAHRRRQRPRSESDARRPSAPRRSTPRRR